MTRASFFSIRQFVFGKSKLLGKIDESKDFKKHSLAIFFTKKGKSIHKF